MTKKRSAADRRRDLAESVKSALEQSDAEKPSSSGVLGVTLGQQREGLLKEVETLRRAHVDAMDSGQMLMQLDPGLVVDPLPSDRLRASFEDVAFLELKESIGRDEQTVPIVVRKGTGGNYEIAAGRRRLEACRQLGIPVLARVQNLDDDEMLQVQHQENEQRADITTFERALWYKSVQGKHGLSTRELAERFGQKQPVIVRYLQMAKLPEALVQALDDPRELSIGDVEKLTKVMKVVDVSTLVGRALSCRGRGTKRQIKDMLAKGPREDVGLTAVDFHIGEKKYGTLRVRKALPESVVEELQATFAEILERHGVK